MWMGQILHSVKRLSGKVYIEGEASEELVDYIEIELLEAREWMKSYCEAID